PHYVDHALRQTNQSAPMTKTEQYIMHMQHLGKIEQISQELKGQLTMIIRDSSFLKPDLLENVQLSIMLKPAHLGNMHIKFAQIDGEMMVHMLVSSQAAKDMLESNLHQLKSVFSPHQIVIEREEQVLEDEYLSEEESPDEQANEEHFQDGTQDESNQSANKETQEIDFETLFQAVRKEETV